MIGLGFFLGGFLFKTVLAATLVSMAIAGLAYFAVKITVNVLRKYKQKKASKLVMANMGSLIKSIPNQKERTFSFDELEELEKVSDETIVAEYDEEKDEIIQANFANKKEKWDDNIDTALNSNDGIILIKD